MYIWAGKIYTMSGVFFLSDMGMGSLSLARMKGFILQGNPRAGLVDISHDLKEYEVIDAALYLKNVISALPENSIIVCYVDCFYAETSQYLVVAADNRYFLAPDNGVLSFALEGKNCEAYLLGNSDYGAWPGKIFAEAAAKLSMGLTPEELGRKVDDYKEFYQLKPIVTENSIRATIISSDRYGNLILNLHKETFEKTRDNRRFSIHYRHDDPITYISNHYAEVEIGDVLARFNSLGYLEIAVNHSPAVEELNVKINDLIKIEFY